ncbi:MAG: tetratricopeptide repeat protein [Kiritimatiellia bacterium]
MMEAEKKSCTALVDWGVSLALAGLAFLVYWMTRADYVFPGESAHLMAVWRGLDVSVYNDYPLMGWFARTFGVGNSFSVVCGAVAVCALYHFFLNYTRVRVSGENTAVYSVSSSRLGATAAALVFMFTPAVHFASTHLEPRIFEAAWALLAFAVLIPYARLPKGVAWLMPVLSAVMVGLGAVDAPLFLGLAPLYFTAVWTSAAARGQKGYGPAAVFLLVAMLTFFVFEACAIGDLGAWGRTTLLAAKSWFDGAWLAVAILATLPFVVSLFSGDSAFGGKPGVTTWLFHIAMTLAAILGVSALSPSTVMRPYGVTPVAASAFVAFVVGYLVVYWWLQIKAVTQVGASVADKTKAAVRIGRPLGMAVGGIFVVAVGISIMLGVAAFDRASGAFADKVANRILDDLGERTWFVTEGTLDDHLRLAAHARTPGKKLNLVCLQRENDKAYLAHLTELVKTENVGGSESVNTSLRTSLSLGILPFIQDWLAADPVAAAKSIAIFSAPDLWFSAKKGAVSLRPVPEFLFFGADEAKFPSGESWTAAWETFDPILAVPSRRDSAKVWGSYRLGEERNPTVRLRLGLRRHIGMVANNRGVWFHDAQDPEKAFGMYEAVMNGIDADNVCALFNELELAGAKMPKAVAKSAELERKINAIVADKTRRYILHRLGQVYGYIRSPRVFIELGYAWARSGRPGEALDQVRRAIDFIPVEKRSAVMNMMAALYASESEGRKSREIYEQVLEKDAENHDALIGLMRLALLDGDSAQAIAYLQRATEAAGDDPRANTELALLHLMRNELAEAKALLVKVTDANRDNLQAWSLLAAVTIQQIDASKDEAEKKKLTNELENDILRTMEKQARGASDYYVQTVRAFILMRQGEEHRRAARDAFVAAAKGRPDVEATGDIILGLDIALNDTVDAERQARDVLRRNRKAPLANYVMGSLALQKGQYAEAETFLRRSADAQRPVVLAMNDLAEVLRRTRDKADDPDARLAEAQRYAEMATKRAPDLYVAWETLASILLARNADLDRAEACVNKACELSRGENGKETDVRMLITLARIQLARGDVTRGKSTLRRVSSRIGELSDFEKEEFEELRKSAK